MGIGTIQKNKYAHSKNIYTLEAKVKSLRFRGDALGKAVIEEDIIVTDNITISVPSLFNLFKTVEFRYSILYDTATKNRYLESKGTFVKIDGFVNHFDAVSSIVDAGRDVSDYIGEQDASFIPVLNFKIKHNRRSKEYCLGYIDRGVGFCPFFSLNHSDSKLYTELDVVTASEIICMIAHSQATFWKAANAVKRVSDSDYFRLLLYTLNRAK